jgi:Flp pilus assembly protein TadG
VFSKTQIPAAETTHKAASPASVSRRRRSGGSIIVECAFTLLPLLALIFAFADFSLLLFRWSTLENAVRQGCRYAITFQTSGSLGQNASIEQVVQQYAMGVVTTSDSPQHIFVSYYSPANLTTPITTGGNIPGNVVQVSVQNVSWAWLAPLSGTLATGPLFATSPLSLNIYSSDILGGYPAGVNSVPE